LPKAFGKLKRKTSVQLYVDQNLPIIQGRWSTDETVALYTVKRFCSRNVEDVLKFYNTLGVIYPSLQINPKRLRHVQGKLANLARYKCVYHKHIKPNEREI
jgi:hypothetical protein